MKYILTFDDYVKMNESLEHLTIKPSPKKGFNDSFNQRINIQLNGKSIGYTLLVSHKPEMISFEYTEIKPEYRNMGYGTKAKILIKEYIKGEYPQVKTIFASPYSKQSFYSLIKAFGQPASEEHETFDEIKGFVDEYLPDTFDGKIDGADYIDLSFNI
jgi:hypothetical protein